MDDLTTLVMERSGVTPAQAERAVTTVLDYLTAKLPSPLVGRIHAVLRDAPASSVPVAEAIPAR
jgi:hypothetical protein